MPTDMPDDADQNDGSWFLEAVGATPPTPSGTDQMAELTKENEVIDSTAAPPDPDEPESVEGQDEINTADSAEHPDSDDRDDSSIRDDDPPVDRDEPTQQHDAPLANTFIRTTQITISSFDGNPGTVNATYDGPAPIAPPPKPASPLPRPDPATPAPAAGAAPTDETSVDSTAVDEDLSRALRSRRSFRWPIVVVLVLLIAGVGAAAIWLPRATETEALAVRQEYYDATSAVRNHLPDAQGALDAITDTESSTEELAGSVPAIARLVTLASDMQRTAAEPLPSVLPLIPKGSIDALEPLRDQTSLLGSEGSEMAQRLSSAYIYRVEIPGLMDVVNLPTSATTETINTISVTLAASLSDDSGVIARLPSDAVFETIRTDAIAAHARYTQWQGEYLNALASENTPAALVLVAELDTMRTVLNADNALALGVFRSELDDTIVTYAVQLEAHMGIISQG